MVSVPGLEKPFEPSLSVLCQEFFKYRPHRDFKVTDKMITMSLSSVFPTRSECMYSSRPVPVLLYLLCFAPGKIIYQLI